MEQFTDDEVEAFKGPPRPWKVRGAAAREHGFRLVLQAEAHDADAAVEAARQTVTDWLNDQGIVESVAGVEVR